MLYTGYLTVEIQNIATTLFSEVKFWQRFAYFKDGRVKV